MLQHTGSRSSHGPITRDPMAPVVERIRGEFREMPGLTLTSAQARRLWSLDESTCNSALDQLVATGFLSRKGDGGYCRVSDLAAGPMRMAKARIEERASRKSSGKS